MLDAIVIGVIFILILVIYLTFLNILRIKSKVEELSIKLDYIENKLDK
jgi:predicted Holliday junction resolvase-like endonuclease